MNSPLFLYPYIIAELGNQEAKNIYILSALKKLALCFVLNIFSAFCLLSQSVLMIGDSHVAGKIYPQTVDSILKCNSIECDFHYFGINGAAFPTFCKEEIMDSITAHNPDVIIVHLGTNDSYSRRFYKEQFLNNITQFYDSVHARLPKAKLVFVTPFVNKLKRYIRNKRHYTRELNKNTILCAEIIEQFCREHSNTWCVNNNASHGMDFLNQNLTSKDFVHLSADGYVILGRQVTEDLMKIPRLFSRNMWWNIDVQKINTIPNILIHTTTINLK